MIRVLKDKRPIMNALINSDQDEDVKLSRMCHKVDFKLKVFEFPLIVAKPFRVPMLFVLLPLQRLVVVPFALPIHFILVHLFVSDSFVALRAFAVSIWLA